MNENVGSRSTQTEGILKSNKKIKTEKYNPSKSYTTWGLTGEWRGWREELVILKQEQWKGPSLNNREKIHREKQ